MKPTCNTNMEHATPDNTINIEKDPPTVLLLYTDLMFGVQLQNIARKSGFRYVAVRPGQPLPQGDILVVDLASRADWEPLVREAASQGVPVVGFGPHMDAEARKRAKAAGAKRVLTNSNLARDLPKVLETMRRERDVMRNA